MRTSRFAGTERPPHAALVSASAALQKSDPELSFEATGGTFGAPPTFVMRTTARHNLATSFTRALLRTRILTNTAALATMSAVYASKRALHPINNVKQPKNKRRLASALSLSISSISIAGSDGGPGKI
jgi:hypothetical protein